MKPSEEEFQRVGLLAILLQFATNPNIDIATKLAIREATLKVLNEHPVNDKIENHVKIKMR
jgi:hypothetical protein